MAVGVATSRQAGEPALQSLAAAPALTALGSSPRGLTAAEAAARLARDGRNELPRPRGRSLLLRFAAQFTDLFAVMLLVAAGITMLAYLFSRPHETGDLQLTVAILAVVVLNALIGFGQEYAAERTAAALQAMVPRLARVLRDGERVEVPAAEIVGGDLLVLEAGDAVSADARVVEAHGLAVNNTALTGESQPVRRTADPVRDGVPRLDARNLVWMGTTVAAGTGKAVVAATGLGTEFGRIYRLTAQTEAERSPLQRKVAAMARRVALGCCRTCGCWPPRRSVWPPCARSAMCRRCSGCSTPRRCRPRTGRSSWASASRCCSPTSSERH